MRFVKIKAEELNLKEGYSKEDYEELGLLFCNKIEPIIKQFMKENKLNKKDIINVLYETIYHAQFKI